ncbi:ion transporter [Kiritimatiellaeota bacterium B1221]|nr:ion transporter [Kiritimatiellaeota bacterium B1221]
MSATENTRRSPLKQKCYTIIFEADTPAGKGFDLLLILAILFSVTATSLDSVASLHERYLQLFSGLEIFFTVVFGVEYLLRLWCAPRPLGYAKSFFGVIDLIGWLPSVMGLLFPGSEVLTTFRVIRVLRVFRVLKMGKYLKEAQVLAQALRDSSRKILVFLFAVLTLVVLLGSLMYLIEGPTHGFTSIPVSVYWAIVTLTTVGYGDISPQTPLGQFFASMIMILGYAILAVPTGIVSAAFVRGDSKATIPEERGNKTANHS